MCERNVWVYRFFVVMGCALGISHIGAACAKNAKPECSSASLAKIEGEYTAEAIAKCSGKTRERETCEEMPAIEAKYAARREEWMRCR
jgi:hypothetical protein